MNNVNDMLSVSKIKFFKSFRANHSSGFTLVELMVAVAIICVLASVGVPALINYMPDYRLKVAARDLYSNMRAAKIQAIKQNKDWAIVFDVVNGRYYVCSDQGGDGSWGDGVAGSADMTGTGDNDIPKTVTMSSYKSGIKFGHGLATIDATVTANVFPDDTPATNISYTNNNDIVTFNSSGGGKAGYVYLSNNNDSASFAIGTGSSGVIYIKKWRGANNNWD